MPEPQLSNQAQAYDAQGNPLAPEVVGEAAAKGQAFFQKGTKVYAKNPTGQLVTIAAEDVGAPGYTVLTQEQLKQERLKREAESTSGLAKTAGEGLARGATMGLLGPEQFYDKEGREAALARQRYNPNLSAGTEIAGTIGAATAAALLTGGASTAATGELTAARLAALGARGALTPFRVANALGSAVEGGVARLAGEGILGRGLALGARGAAEGALFGAGHEVSQAALEDVPLTAERLLAGAWDGAKLGGAFGAGVGVLGAGLGKAGRAIVGRMSSEGDDMSTAIGRWASERKFKQGVGNNGRIYDSATKFGTDMQGPARIGRKLLDAQVPEETGAALRRVTQLADDAVTRMDDVARVMDQSGAAPDAQRIINTVRDQVSKLKETPIASVQKVAKRVEREFDPWVKQIESGQGTTFSDILEHRRKLDSTLLNWEKKARGPAEEALRDMVGAFRSEIDDSIARAAETGAAPAELLGAWKKATEDYGDFALIKKSLKELTKRESKNRWMSASDYGTGGAAGLLVGVLSGNPIAGVATSALTGAAHKLIRERGAGVIARIADRAGSAAGRMELAGKVAAMIEAPKAIAIPTAVKVGEQFDRYSKILTEAQVQPAQFAKRIGDATADLGIRFPELAQHVQQTLVGDLDYLQQIHPKPASREMNSLTPQAVKPQFYSFNQKKAFADAATALDNPLGVFEDIAHGDLPMTKIQALKIRRPALWQDMRKTVVKYTMQRETELPYSRRVLLGTAFDFPADWSMLNVGMIQTSLAPEVQSKNDPRAAPSKVGKDPGADIQPQGF